MKTLENPSIVEKLQKSKKLYQGTWEHDSVYLFDSIRTYEDLASALMLTDANDLIVSMRDITPMVARDLTKVQRKDLASRVSNHLHDDRMCSTEYGFFQSDEEEAITVAHAANYALNYLRKLV